MEQARPLLARDADARVRDLEADRDRVVQFL
jgi:hypothetical protein